MASSAAATTGTKPSPRGDALPSQTALALAGVDFEALQTQLELERELSDAIRDASKDLERSYRRLASHFNRMHSVRASELIDQVVEPSGSIFAQVRDQTTRLAQLIPPNRYYQWNNQFDHQIRNLASLAALAYFLGTRSLLSRKHTEQILGMSDSIADRLLLSTENYLIALTSLTNELSRFAVTSVTQGDFSTPLVLSHFVKDLHGGFQLLNLKNNDLRRRFDSIKYDVKKIEEVVYDISLRGLLKGDQQAQGMRVDTTQEDVDRVLAILTK